MLLIDSAYMFVLFWMVPPIMSRGFFTKMWGYCGKYWRCLLSGRKDGPRTSTAYKNPVREVPAPLQPLEYTQNKSENKSKIVQNFRLAVDIAAEKVSIAAQAGVHDRESTRRGVYDRFPLGGHGFD